MAPNDSSTDRSRPARGFARLSVTISTAVIVTALAAAGWVAFHGEKAKAATAKPAASPVAVSVATVARASITEWDEFSGRLEAVERVDVRARVSGAVQAIHFREGSLVKAGDLLVTVDPAPYAAEVERAQAQAAAADARLSHQRLEQQRATRLWEERAIAQRELDERNDGVREAEANLRSARASLTSMKLNLGYTQVRAPISGRVGKIDVTVGNLIAAGPTSPVLTTLVSVNPIYASFDVDEQVVLRALDDLPGGGADRSQISRVPVRMGTVNSDGTPHTGQLQLIDNQVDTHSGTIRVRGRFDNADGALIPGQFARLRLGRARPSDQVLINERAVGTDQDKKFVLVVGADNKTAYREVTLGATVDGLRVVTSGLQPDERIVVSGLQRVKSGVLVTPQPVAMGGGA